MFTFTPSLMTAFMYIWRWAQNKTSNKHVNNFIWGWVWVEPHNFLSKVPTQIFRICSLVLAPYQIQIWTEWEEDLQMLLHSPGFPNLQPMFHRNSQQTAFWLESQTYTSSKLPCETYVSNKCYQIYLAHFGQSVTRNNDIAWQFSLLKAPIDLQKEQALKV